MFTQINYLQPITVLEKGPDRSSAVINYGLEHNLARVTAHDSSGNILWAANPRVRTEANWFLGRPKDAFVVATGIKAMPV